MDETDKRSWERYGLEKSADIKTAKDTHRRELNDLSAGGASMQGDVADFDDGEIEIDIGEFGNFAASVVREWDDGFAVEFEMDEDDRYSLQEDLEEFKRENDLD